jgi:hypothetical protein
MGVAHLPFAILAKVFGVIAPLVTIERDFQERDWQNLRGAGIRAIHLAAKPHRDAIDQKGVEENIPDAGQ